MTESINLSAVFSIENEELVLVYEVTNNDTLDVYLLNRLFRSTPAWELSPAVIYVHLQRDDKTVWLNKKIADIPKDVNVTAPVSPFVTPVRSGAAFKEEVRIPLPVVEYRQYGAYGGGPSEAARKSEPVPVTYEYVFFTLGYFWGAKGTTEETRDIQGTEVIIPTLPPEARPPRFGELHTELKRLDIPVLEARGGS